MALMKVAVALDRTVGGGGWGVKEVAIRELNFCMKKFHRRPIDCRHDFGGDFADLAWAADLSWRSPPL